jgi:hypothetical protein
VNHMVEFGMEGNTSPWRSTFVSRFHAPSRSAVLHLCRHPVAEATFALVPDLRLEQLRQFSEQVQQRVRRDA